jgi:uncharacterized surface protein with fasciclin (FAS1) repeats
MQTFTKKFLLTTLLATASLSFSKLSDEAVSNCFNTQKEGSEKYLEYHFVFKLNNALQNAQTNLAVGISATAATALLLSQTPTAKNVVTVPTDNATLIASGMLCMAAGYSYYCSLESRLKSEILVNFLKNWSYHRQFLPDDFTSAFDELAAYQQDGKTFSNDQLKEIFELVLHYVEHTFEKRYPKEKKSPDLLASVKTITEIGKNLSSGK